MPFPSQPQNDDVQAGVIAALLAEVADLIEERVFPNVIPQEVAHIECIRVSLVSDPSYKVLSGHAGTARATIQVDCFGDHKGNVNYLAKRCKIRLMNHNGQLGELIVNSTRKLNELDEGDLPQDGSDRFRYRRLLRFEIDHCEDTELAE